MATTASTLTREASPGRRAVFSGAALLGLFIISGLAFAFNYWAGLLLLFGGLLVLIYLALNPYEGRNLGLLLISSLFVIAVVSSLTQTLLANNPAIDELAQSDNVANIFLGSDGAIFLTSLLVGLVAAVLLVLIPFLLLTAIATVGILEWHKADEDISFFEVWRYMLVSLLGLFHFCVVVEDGEAKGTVRDKELLDKFGGPGWLEVGPGHVVVLHRWSKITRAVGQGSTMLKRQEKIKAILPLGTKANINEIPNVLTRDRIPLTVKVLHVAQMEPAADTKARLESELIRLEEDDEAERSQIQEAKDCLKALENDRLIGDDYNQVYESTAWRTATKSPDVWAGLRGPVANNIKDVIMSCSSHDLFSTGDESGDLSHNIENRRIAAIESAVIERAKGSGTAKGLVLRTVDLNEIHYPDEIKKKVNQEATALTDARIKRVEARARVEEARSEEVAARYRAGAQLNLAQADADAGKLKAESKAEHYNRIIQVLNQQRQSDDTIRAVLENISSSKALEDELEQLLDLLAHHVKEVVSRS